MAGGGRSAFSLYPDHQLGVVILTNLLGANPEDLTDEVAAAFDQKLTLTGVLKLRAEAEERKFSNLTSLLAATETRNASDELDQDELNHWISSLLWSGNLPRALELAKFGLKIYPTSTNSMELLARAYASNALEEDAIRMFMLLRTRDPSNAAARAYLEKK